MNHCKEMPPYRRERSRRRTHRKICQRKIRTALSILLLAMFAASGIWLWQMNQPLPGEDVILPDYVQETHLPVNRFSRPGIPLEEINGVVIHYVGNPNTTAEANRNYFASLSTGQANTFASSHFIVGLEGEVLQCIPLTEIAYASKDRNGDTIAIEVCHPDETGKFSEITYERIVELTAWLCYTFDLEPATDVIRHYDVTGKRCPNYYVEHPDAWNTLRSNITSQLERLTGKTEKNSILIL